MVAAAFAVTAPAAPDSAPPARIPIKDPAKIGTRPSTAEKAPGREAVKVDDPPPIPLKTTVGLSPAARKVVHPGTLAEMEAMARADPLAFMKMSLKWYEDHVTSYTCTFVKQEEIGGELLKTETMDMKFREKPFSAHFRWDNPSKGQEAMYVEGANKNKLVVHPIGFLAILFPTVRIEPTDDRALKKARRPITCAGLGNMIRFIIPPTEEALKNGDLQLEYLGLREEGGRPAYVFKRTLPRGKEYPCYTMTLYIDQQFLIPVRSDAYNWDGELQGHYRYMDLILNPPLTDDDFNPDKKF